MALFWARRLLGILLGAVAVLLVTGSTAGVMVPGAFLIGFGVPLLAAGGYLYMRRRVLEFIPPDVVPEAISHVEQALALADSNLDAELFYSPLGRAVSEDKDVVGDDPEATRSAARDLAVALHIALRKHNQLSVQKNPELGTDIVVEPDPIAALAEFDAALTNWANSHPPRMAHDGATTVAGWLEHAVRQAEWGLGDRRRTMPSTIALTTMLARRLERLR